MYKQPKTKNKNKQAKQNKNKNNTKENMKQLKCRILFNFHVVQSLG
jgi:hypothetical protein